ncbi:31276_t:CDS:2, partial [Racocetra persica]
PYVYSELITYGDKPPPLAVHTANLYQNYLIVAFGNITNDLVPPVDLNPLIYILDIPCKTWVTTFTPGKSICSIEPNITNGLTIGIVVGIIIACCFVLVAIILFILWKLEVVRFSSLRNTNPPPPPPPQRP